MAATMRRRTDHECVVFNLFQSLGFYGFASWVPTLLVARWLTVTHSLLYSFCDRDFLKSLRAMDLHDDPPTDSNA